MLVTVLKYVEIIAHSRMFTRSLGAIDVFTDAAMRPVFIAGSRSVVFKIRHGGRAMMLKCYTSPKPNIRRIYGERCLREELFIPEGTDSGRWVDVVLCDWIEGRTLRCAVAEAAGDGEALGRLAREFDRFASELLGAEWTHGDLKPDNIIVDCGGAMHAIDFDAVYRPDLADLRSDEAGTAAFQHPLRTAELYDDSMDDYPAALISSALHALAADPTLSGRYDTDEIMLFLPREVCEGRSAAFEEVAELFSRRGMAASYRILMMLRSPSPRLEGLRELLEWSPDDAEACETPPALACRDGLWGYERGGRFVIPPMFDDGFEFSEGLAAVRTGRSWHFITTSGRTVMNLGECDAVKPFSNGTAVIMRGGSRVEVDKTEAATYPPPML